MTESVNADRLEKLVRARHACISIVTGEETYALALVKSVAMSTGLPLLEWSVTRGVRGALLEGGEPAAATEHPAAGLYHLAHQVPHPTLAVTLDVAGHLDDARTLRVLRECIERFREMRSALLMIDHTDRLPSVVLDSATPFEIEPPDAEQIERILRRRLREMHREEKIHVDLPRHAFDSIVRNFTGLARGEVERIVTEIVSEDRRLDEADLDQVITAKRRLMRGQGLLEFIETPADLRDIGGLHRLKRWLEVRRRALGREATDFGLDPPRGMLLLGVQGAGKSLCAKAIATAWRRPLLRMDPGALYDRYIGESERRLRDTLRQAERMAPIVLWIDEIEKGFASAASRSSDGGLSQRMFGTFLTWMQDHRAPVFIAATANDVEALPPELLRKGRFDEIFFVDLPDAATRREIFAIHLQKRKRKPEAFDLDRLAAASNGFSGAEIEQAVIAALYETFTAGGELTTEYLLASLSSSPPLSVTMAERVVALRQWAAGRCVPAH